MKREKETAHDILGFQRLVDATMCNYVHIKGNYMAFNAGCEPEQNNKNINFFWTYLDAKIYFRNLNN